MPHYQPGHPPITAPATIAGAGPRPRGRGYTPGVPGPPRISVAELAAGAADFPLLDGLLDDAGQVAGPPLIAVDLTDLTDQTDPGSRTGQARPPGRTNLATAVTRAADCPRLLVGVSVGPLSPRAAPLLRALDVTLTAASAAPPECVTVPDPGAALRALHVAATATPQAALVLSQLLRATAELPVRAALDMESLAYSTLLGGREFQAWLRAQPARKAPPLVQDPVLIRREDDTLKITLNRPERRNAYGRQLRDALADALRVALLDPEATPVVLDGAGPSFSSGGDLAEFGTAPDLATAHFVRTQAGAALLLHALRDRAEVQVHGPCVGAGVELPAYAATVVAAQDTTFRLPEVAMGLVPGAGGTVSITRRIGRWRTLYLALAGHPLDTATALDWGLVDRIG